MKKKIIRVIWVYCFSWLFSLVFILFNIFENTSSFKRAVRFLWEVISSSGFLLFQHALFLVFFLLFLILLYFIRTYKKRGVHIFLKRLLFRLILPVGSVILIFKIIIWNNRNEQFDYQWDYSVENKSLEAKDLYRFDKKHRGISVFGWREDNNKAIESMVQYNVEWAAIIPFIYQKDEASSTINSGDSIYAIQNKTRYTKSIAQLKAKGIHTQLKPHLWLGDGWRSNIKQKSATDWDIWFASYRKKMLHYAKFAEETGVELFCIGTELRTSVKNQPEAWITFIEDIRKVYHGKLTYAANWDDRIEDIPFWKDLDYIGVQAYFPLTKNKNPDLESIKEGWDKHIKKLETLALATNKPILFTEIGYKSEASSTIKPWEWPTFFGSLYQKKSHKTQQLAYQAMFEKLWDKDWFAGAYIWDWNIRSKKENASRSLGFSIQYKPAGNTLTKWYGTKGKPVNLSNP